MLTNERRTQIRQSLEQLGLNFSGSRAMPSFDDVESHFAKTRDILPAVGLLLAGTAADQLYAAILLSELDSATAVKTFDRLCRDARPIRVQKRIGHGSVEIPVRFASESFRRTGAVDGGFVAVGARLEAWKSEAADAILPETVPLLELLENDPESARQTIARFASTDNAIHRFYAAGALAALGQGEEKPILESLLADETPVRIVVGDIAMPFPAKDVAAALLEGGELPSDESASEEESNDGLFGAIRRFFRN